MNSDLQEFAKEIAGLAARSAVGIAEERFRSHLENIYGRIGELSSQIQTLKTERAVPSIKPFSKAPRVLLVDDNVQLVHAWQLWLEAHGMDVYASTGVNDALGFLEGDPGLEVAVVDVVMPKNGHTLLQHVRDDHRGVQVIMTSGEDVDPRRALDSGAFGFLAKPFEPAELVLLVTRAAERRRSNLAAGLRE